MRLLTEHTGCGEVLEDTSERFGLECLAADQEGVSVLPIEHCPHRTVKKGFRACSQRATPGRVPARSGCAGSSLYPSSGRGPGASGVARVSDPVDGARSRALWNDGHSYQRYLLRNV